MLKVVCVLKVFNELISPLPIQEAFVLLDLIGHKDTNFRRYFKETDGLFTQLVEFGE